MWFCPIDGTLLLIGDHIHHRNHTNNTINHDNDDQDGKQNYFYCRTCPYNCPVQEQQMIGHSTKKKGMKQNSNNTTGKVVITSDLSKYYNNSSKRRMMKMSKNNNSNDDDTDYDNDILGGKNAWDNVDRTAIVCNKCQGPQAYFFQIQIRSADEPMTIFYKCCTCSYQWNE